MWPLIVAIVLVAVVLNAGAVLSLVTQRSANVRAMSKEKYRIRLMAANVHWVAWSNWDMSWLYGTFEWIRHLRRSRVWNVTVQPRTARWDDPPLYGEEFPTWRAACRRVDILATAIETGVVSLSESSNNAGSE